MKKAWKIVSTILVWLLVLVAIGMMVFTVISVNTFDRNDRTVFGHKMYIVLSDSMSATDFDAGDLVVIREVDPATLQAGDIVAFVSQNADSYGQVTTHKIRRMTVTESGEPGFITYGTTTDTDDEGVVTYPYVQGKYVFAIPKLGSFFQFLKTPQGYLLCILLPFMLLILYQGISCVRIFRQYKKEQMEELQAQKDEIEAERKRAEQMMEQLLELKQQMTAPATEAEGQNSSQQVDVAAMMEELAALRAQVAGQQNEPVPENEEQPV